MTSSPGSPTFSEECEIKEMLSSSPAQDSMIFERMVQDPMTQAPVVNCPRCGKYRNECHHQSILHLPQHFQNENFIPAALDSTTSLISSNANLDEVEMISPPRKNSMVNFPTFSRRGSTLDRSQSFSVANAARPNISPHKSTLSFYSYADMINKEDQEGNYLTRRPSISQTLSTSFLPACSSPRNLQSLNNFSFSRPSSSARERTPSLSRQKQKAFNLESTSESSDNENENENEEESPKPQPTRPFRKGSTASRLQRTLSNASSMTNRLSRPPTMNNMDNVFAEDTDNESLVVSNVGETLRRYTSELRG